MAQSSVQQDMPGILIVDDAPENLQVLERFLIIKGYRTRPVPSGKLALQAVESDPPDPILLDIHMPGIDGYEVCRRLKENEKLRDIPVLFLSHRRGQWYALRPECGGGVCRTRRAVQRGPG